MAADVKTAVMYRGRDDGLDAVAIIAEITGLQRPSVYSYLDGKTKMSVDFLHAAFLATNGDHDIGKYLEPEGWRLDPADWPTPDKAHVAEQCLMDLPALAEFHRLIHSDAPQHEIKAAKKALIREIQRSYVFWCKNHGKKP